MSKFCVIFLIVSVCVVLSPADPGNRRKSDLLNFLLIFKTNSNPILSFDQVYCIVLKKAYRFWNENQKWLLSTKLLLSKSNSHVNRTNVDHRKRNMSLKSVHVNQTDVKHAVTSAAVMRNVIRNVLLSKNAGKQKLEWNKTKTEKLSNWFE